MGRQTQADDATDDEPLPDHTEEEKLEELRNFREQTRELGNDELGLYGEPQTEEGDESDERQIEVTESGETENYTREEWEERPDTRIRTWERMARSGNMFVRVADWFSSEDVNRVQTGRGFYGHKAGETEKALKFNVPAREGHTAEPEVVWVPKKAVRTHKLTE